MPKRQSPSQTSTLTAAWPILAEQPAGKGARETMLDQAIAMAMDMLADAPPGETATISVCRGAPLCHVSNPAVGFTAACPMCECLTVSEDGIVGHPGSGKA